MLMADSCLLHRQLFLHPARRFQLGLGRQIHHQTLQHHPFADGTGAQRQVGLGYEADRARQFAAVLVAAGLLMMSSAANGGTRNPCHNAAQSMRWSRTLRSRITSIWRKVFASM